MELAALIKDRRSIHLFEDREVSAELIKELLEIAIWVPNYRMTQPWRFIMSYGEGRQKIANTFREIRESETDEASRYEAGQRFYNKFMAVPIMITVVMKEDPSLIVREEDYASCCCIIQNLSLLAWQQGIGLVWETYGLLLYPHFRESMGILPGEKVIGNLHIGYPAKIPAVQPRVPASERITVIESV